MWCFCCCSGLPPGCRLQCLWTLRTLPYSWWTLTVKCLVNISNLGIVLTCWGAVKIDCYLLLVSALQNDAKKEMPLICTKMSYFNLQVLLSWKVAQQVYFPSHRLIWLINQNLAIENCHHWNPLKKLALQSDNFFMAVIF